jgi:hypothetical protein
MTAFFWRQVAMLSSEDAGHGGFFGYHFVVLLMGCFPASAFALQEMLKSSTRTEYGRQPDNGQLTTDNSATEHRPKMDGDPLLGRVDPLQCGEDQDRPLQQPVLLPAHLPRRAATGAPMDLAESPDRIRVVALP